MAIKKILVPLNSRHSSDDPASLDVPALQAAVKLGRRLQAYVEVLSVTDATPATDWANWIPDFGTKLVLEGLAKQGEARRRNAARSYESVIAREKDFQAGFVEKQGDIATMVGAAGRLADLLVIASPKTRWEIAFRPVLEAALRETARPVFVVPTVAPDQVVNHVTIAWNDTVESARALSASMPLLRIAQSVTVLTCREAGKPSLLSSGEGVVSYLGRHDVEAKSTEIEAIDRRPAGEIIDAALAQGSDLLVLGSVIHSRTHTLFYGSLTEEALKNPRICSYLVP